MQLLGTYVWPEDLASLDERELNRLRRSGTNTVVVGVTQHRPKAGVYFKTDWAPVLQDRLAAVVGAVHQQSLQIWAALSVRRVGWGCPGVGGAGGGGEPRKPRPGPGRTPGPPAPAPPGFPVGVFTAPAAPGIRGPL